LNVIDLLAWDVCKMKILCCGKDINLDIMSPVGVAIDGIFKSYTTPANIPNLSDSFEVRTKGKEHVAGHPVALIFTAFYASFNGHFPLPPLIEDLPSATMSDFQKTYLKDGCKKNSIAPRLDLLKIPVR
jgi:hypothetical protein